MEEYLTPLATVPSWEFDQYKDVLEQTVEQRIEDIPDHTSDYNFGNSGNNQDLYAVERRIYGDLLENIDDIDSKTELMKYSQEQVESSESVLPTPFDLFMKPFDILIEGQRANLVEEVFEEAKQEFNAQI